MLIEQLQARIVFDASPIEPMTEVEIRRSLSLTEHALPQPPLTLEFLAINRTAEDVSYPGYDDTPDQQLWMRHVPFRTKIDDLIASDASEFSRSEWQIRLTNPDNFVVLPNLEANELCFEVTGKDGVKSQSIIQLVAKSNESLSKTILVDIDNGSIDNEHDEGHFEQQELEGEGEAIGFPVMVGSGSGPGPGSGSGSGSGPITGSLVLQSASSTDSRAEEPHVIYGNSVDSIGIFNINRINWGGGNVRIEVSGVAKWGMDYSIGTTITQISPAVFEIFVAPGNGIVSVPVNALQDNVEPGKQDSQGHVEAAEELATFTFQTGQAANLSGTANVTIVDLLEGVNLNADPAQTSELGGPPAVFHVRPAHAGMVLNTSLHWDIITYTPAASAPHGKAVLSTDYSVNDEISLPALQFSVFNSSNAPEVIVRSNARPVSMDNDFQLSAAAFNDNILEGSETFSVRAFVPAIGFTTSWVDGTITEAYRHGKVERDERTGCSCTCTTCVDSNAVSQDAASGQVTATAAGGHVVVMTSGQDGLKPVVHIGITLPSSVAGLNSIGVQIHVVEEQTDSNNQLVGLGRRLAANSLVTGNVTFDIPASALPGNTLWFSMQADLAAFASSWTRGSNTPRGSTGVTERVLPLEVLVNAGYSASTPWDQKISGWVGRTNHAMRNENASSIAPFSAPNTRVAGLDRLISDMTILVPDTAAPPTQIGRVIRESGTMLFRANGTTSWFKNGTQPAPDSLDTIQGNTITDRYGNKSVFNGLGDLIQRIDASGNVWSYTYYADGGIASITAPDNNVTFFERLTNGQGIAYVRIINYQTTGSINNARTWDVTYIPSTGTMTVQHLDPDGTGPRQSRQDIYTYTGFALSSVTSGNSSDGWHTTSLSYGGNPATGFGRVATIAYADGSRIDLELVRQRNALIVAGFSGNVPVTWDASPRVGAANPIPNYAVITSYRSSSSSPQRSIYQLDHRGRSLRAIAR